MSDERRLPTKFERDSLTLVANLGIETVSITSRSLRILLFAAEECERLRERLIQKEREYGPALVERDHLRARLAAVEDERDEAAGANILNRNALNRAKARLAKIDGASKPPEFVERLLREHLPDEKFGDGLRQLCALAFLRAVLRECDIQQLKDWSQVKTSELVAWAEADEEKRGQR